MNNHVHIPENKLGVDYIIGDLHGCYATLEMGLKIIGFDKEKDRLFSVGDLVDRGRQNEECAQLLAEPWFYAVTGNHEQMAVDYFEGCGDRRMYGCNGGDWYMVLPKSMQKYYYEMFVKLPVMMTVGNKYGIIHADLPINDWNDLIAAVEPASTKDFSGVIQSCIWGRYKIHCQDETIIKNIEHVFCGHTPVRLPQTLGNVTYIDTGCVFDKHLTIMTLDRTLTYKVPLLKE